jgi:hypothetical protein
MAACASVPRPFATVDTFVRLLPGASKACHVICADGTQKAIKAAHLKKHVVAEHVVARVGQLFQAPVGEVGFAIVPGTIRSAQAELAPYGIDLAHATDWEDGCGERLALEYSSEPYNRERFAAIVVLYTLVHADDPQVIYKKNAPHLVYSVDHGHFLVGGPGTWTDGSLHGAAPLTALHPWAVQVALTQDELRPFRKKLEAITEADFQAIGLGPPDEWGITTAERIALSSYFSRRRDQVLQLLPA